MTRRGNELGSRGSRRRAQAERQTVSFNVSRKFLVSFITITVIHVAILGAAFIRPWLYLDGSAITKAGAQAGAIITAAITAEGNPERITITATAPGMPPETVNICDDSKQCAGAVTFDICGTWILTGVIEYAHEDPSYPGYDYKLAESIAVTVTGCDIFADDFETGDTSNWSNAPRGSNE